MVFDQEAAPSDRSTFLNWFKEQTNWSTDLDYDDPSGTSPALNAWFFDIINSYPALNGPFRSQDEDIAGEKSATTASENPLSMRLSPGAT
jgi:hypothetical protein